MTTSKRIYEALCRLALEGPIVEDQFCRAVDDILAGEKKASKERLAQQFSDKLASALDAVPFEENSFTQCEIDIVRGNVPSPPLPKESDQLTKFKWQAR